MTYWGPLTVKSKGGFYLELYYKFSQNERELG